MIPSIKLFPKKLLKATDKKQAVLRWKIQNEWFFMTLGILRLIHLITFFVRCPNN